MPGSAAPVGPFFGGLNLNEEPSSIEDDQLSSCLNFDIDNAGELVVRPGLKNISNFGTPNAAILLATARTATGFRTYSRSETALYYTDNGTVWTTWGSTIAGRPSTVVQYVQDPVNTTLPVIFVIPKGATAGAVATAGIRHRLSDNVVTNVTGMPNGSAGTVYRERLFIYGQASEGGTGSYRIWYSDPKDFNTYGANSFIDVGPGDGEYITNISIQNDSMIIFKENSSWVFTFENNPGLGVLRKFNSEIGATSPNAVVTYENQLYLIDQRNIFRLINLLFEDISTPIGVGKRRSDASVVLNDFATTLGTRILFAISTGTNTFRYFVYHASLSAWSEYTFVDNPVKFVTSGQTASETFYATKSSSPNVYVFKPYTQVTADWGDAGGGPVAYFSSKEFKYDTPTSFKRLYWWAAEVSGYSGTLSTSVTTDGVVGATKVITPTTIAPKVYKNFVQNRFRRVMFSGTTAGTARLTIHNIRAFVSIKAKVTSGTTT